MGDYGGAYTCPDYSGKDYNGTDYNIVQHTRLGDYASPNFETQAINCGIAVDCYLVRIKTFSLDCVLKKTQTKIFTLNTDLIKTQTKTFKLDLIVDEPGEKKTFSLDTVLLNQDFETFKLDCVLASPEGSAKLSGGDWGQKIKWVDLTVPKIGHMSFIMDMVLTKSLPLQIKEKEKIPTYVGVKPTVRKARTNEDVYIPKTEIKNTIFNIDTIVSKQEIRELVIPEDFESHEPIRNKDLDYLVKHPEQIKKSKNKRLAQQALELLDMNEHLLD